MIVLNFILGLSELLVLVYSAYYYMNHIGREIFRKKWWYVLAFLCYGVVFSILTPLFYSDYVNIGAGLLMVSLIGHFLFNKKGLYIFYYMFYMVCVCICQIAVLLGMQGLLSYIRDPYAYYNICLALKILVVLCVTRFLVFVIRQKKMSRLTRWQHISIFLLPVFSLVFMMSMVIMGQVYAPLYGYGLMAVNMVILLAVNIFFVYLFGYMFKANNLENELKVFKNQNEIQFKYYSQMEKKYEDSRKVIHDMKNHLQAIERLYASRETGEAQSYVEDIYHMLNVLGEKYYTDHHMLNIILNDKLQEAEREGIMVRAAIGDVKLTGIKDLDITTIFANLLDNAIEAAREIKNDAYIDLKMDYFNEFIVVSIRNSMGKSESTKEGHMGIGLENVRYTLEKYHGTLHTGVENGAFQVNIMLPKEEQK